MSVTVTCSKPNSRRNARTLLAGNSSCVPFVGTTVLMTVFVALSLATKMHFVFSSSAPPMKQ